MISFDFLLLKAFFQENKSFFEGARIQKIQAPTRRDLIFNLRNNGETKRFYVNIDPQLFHICFMNSENEQNRVLKIPKKPTMFCMLLRKYIESAKIVEVNVPEYERIFEIYIESFNELNDKIRLCLAIELMGKYSNVVLYNSDTNVIIGCCHNIGEEKSRTREMAGLLPYIYPPKQLKTDILTYNGEISNLNENFLGISKAFEAQLAEKSLSQIKDYVSLKKITPAIDVENNEYSLFSELLKTSETKASVNDLIDDYFTYNQVSIIIKSLKQKLNSIVVPKFKKALNSLDKMSVKLKKEEKAEKYKVYGNLLMANLHNLKDFSKEAIVFNWETNEDMTIVLDETKTIKDNANKFYKLYTKSKTSIMKIKELSEKLNSELSYYENLIFMIEQANDIRVLMEIDEELSPVEKKEIKSEIYEIEYDGYKILVGQNNRQNDLIVSKLSDKDDLWFHAKDCPSSHVLLKNPLKTTPKDDVVLYCAKLAKKYSKAKNSPKAGVIYTYRKNLKKPPAAKLGYVIYKNEIEILVD